MNMIFMQLHRPGASLSQVVRPLLLVLGMSALAAQADEMLDVSRLLKAGKGSDALVRSREFLLKHPNDPQMRFLQGVILAEQNKTEEAIAIFTRLTEDYRDLPEPYNNLAVLYAESGQYDKARLILEKAIRTNPTYLTAYENLGDVYGKLASQAYDKALVLGASNPSPHAKFTLLRSFSSSTGVRLTAPEPGLAAKVNPSPVPGIKLAKATADPAPTPSISIQRDEVLNLVHEWAAAWGAQKVDTYLSFYGMDFEAPAGLSRSAWALERRARIAGKGRIRILVEDPEVTIKGNTAQVNFRQKYESDRLSARSRKTLMLAKQAGKWQIKREISSR